MLFQVRPLVTIFDNDKTQDEILLLSILLWEYLPEQCLREREREGVENTWTWIHVLNYTNKQPPKVYIKKCS